MNRLFYGDNLVVMRESIATESVDLVYLDPPFNSNRAYNVIFNKHARSGNGASAQIQAFGDTWRWTHATDQQYQRLTGAGELPMPAADALMAFHALLGENDALAYLVNMAPRLVDLRRVLKPTGSLYLHCDPTMSHYLKILLDAIFGTERFRAEITWERTTTHNDAKRWSPNADILLYYGKGSTVTWNPALAPYNDGYVDAKYRFTDPDGRRYQLDNITSPNPRPNLTYEWKGHEPPHNGWRYSRETMEQLDSEGRIWYPDSKNKRPRLKRYLDEQSGVVIGNVWTDISPINSRAIERLGYPTQKPLKLLERIINASSNPGDIVLDPFCGCGTAVDAAQRLNRQWIGIDIAYIAIDLIKKRLLHTFGPAATGTYEVLGSPRDIEGAEALAQRSKFDFERWAVTQIDAQPNEKQVGDKGVDGVAWFYLEKNSHGRVLVSVKGGQTVGPQFVRDLVGTIETQKAQMGVLITIAEPTRGVLDAINHGGTYTWPRNGQSYPRVQVITIRELLSGVRPNMPRIQLPYYIQSARAPVPSAQIGFDELAAGSM